MVDVSDKDVTVREAVARGQVRMHEDTLQRIRSGDLPKGEVLAVARVAGIMAAKRTADWIPMCHPLPVSSVSLEFSSDTAGILTIEARVKVTARTGVEMEALCAVSAAALTVYDMCKAVDRDMVVGEIRLVEKSGGRSGRYRRR
jgi:cyclic pyranopterin phosphate synthase